MKGLNYIGFCVLFSAFLAGCTKDDTQPIVTCQSIPDSPPGYSHGYDYAGEYPTFSSPFFNPNKPDEIIYGSRQSEEISAEGQYWHYNLNTGEKQLLLQNVWSPAAYSSTGWLVMDRPGNQIWKIKDNGDSLTQLTSEGVNFMPSWSPDGQRIVFRRTDSPNPSHNGLLITDANGNLLQRIDVPYSTIGLSCWSPDGNKLALVGYYGTTDGILLYDLTTNQISTVASFENEPLTAPGGGCWLPDSRRIAWTNSQGIYITDVVTGHSEHIKPTCNSRKYNWLTVSPDGSELLVSRNDLSLIDDHTLKSKMRIYRMNIDGSNERMVNLE